MNSTDEVPVWEPSTDGRAIDGAPWESSNAGTKQATMWALLYTVVTTATFVWLWVVGAPWPATVFLGLMTVAIVFMTVLFTVGRPLVVRTDRRILESHAWCMATAEVFSRTDQPDSRMFRSDARLLVHGWTERPQWLSWSALTWADEQVVARTGRIWLAGPDRRGRVLLSSAGLAIWNGPAEVVATGDPETALVVAEQAAPLRVARAGDDIVAKATLAYGRRATRWVRLIVLAGLALAAVVVTVVVVGSGPRMVEALVGVGIVVLLPAVSGVPAPSRARRIERLLDAGPWTAVPVTLRAATKLVDNDVPIRGQATLPNGRTVEVRLRAGYSLAANIAATGLLWVAGEPVPGQVVAAGLPGYPVVTLARIGR